MIAATAIRIDTTITTVEWPRKKERGSDWSFAFLHHFAGDVVDCSDVVRIDCVPQPEAIGDKRRRQQLRIAVERREGPGPGQQVRSYQDSVYPDYSGSNTVGSVVENLQRR